MSERDQAEIDALDYRFSRWTLAFADTVVERRFTEGHLKRSLGVIRFAIAAGALLYFAFGILDYLIHPQSYALIWFIRGLVILCLTTLLVSSMTKAFRRWSQPMLGVGTLLSALGIIAMTVVGDDPGRYWYYGGVTLTAIYCANLVGLRFRFAAMLVTLILLLYVVAASIVRATPFDVLLSNLFFLTTAVSVGLFTSYAQELYLRRNFIFTELLLKEKHRSDELLHQARAGIRAKDDFLAVMGHELRTPLNAIIGFSEIMKNRLFGPVGARQYESYIEDIHNSGTHLLGVINAILDLTKAQANTLRLQEEDFDPASLINGCLRMFRETASSKGVRLSFLKPDEMLQVHGDPQLLRQVIVNLVSNAIKFTKTGGGVTVRLEPTPDHGVAFVVEDTGTGIAKEDIARVFEPFVQVDQGLNRVHEGAGLGLPLAMKIMELHGGRLELSSMLGVGTKVTAIVPPTRVGKPTTAIVMETTPLGTAVKPATAAALQPRPRLEVVAGRSVATFTNETQDEKTS